MATLTLLDTKTGETRAVESVGNWVFDWTQNNWSCDCNRQRYFGFDDFTGYCMDQKRFLVIAVDPMPDGVELWEFNDGYPVSLRGDGVPEEALRE